MERVLVVAADPGEGNVVEFTIKNKTLISKVLDAYCLRQGTERASLRFFDPDGIGIPPVCTSMHHVHPIACGVSFLLSQNPIDQLGLFVSYLHVPLERDQRD